MKTFIDTTVLFAEAFRRDQKHDAAHRILEAVPPGESLTTDHVLVECWLLLNGRAGHHLAKRFWRGLRYAPLTLEHVTAADLERAEAIADRWLDQTFSIVDCTSFAVMERIGCSRAASFDADFAIYRYGPDRTRAFEILR